MIVYLLIKIHKRLKLDLKREMLSSNKNFYCREIDHRCAVKYKVNKK